MTAPPLPRFVHETFLYRGGEEFLAGLLPYVREGLAQDETVVVAEPHPRRRELEEALGGDADRVRWVDPTHVNDNPGRLMPLLAATMAEHTGGGRRLRVVGEGAHADRHAAELVECAVHEAIVNHVFAAGPAWRLLCPYDVAVLPAAAPEAARRTHPWSWGPGGGRPNPSYVPAGDGADLATLTGAAPLLPPTDVVLRGDFGRRDLPAVRRTVRQYARSCGLDDEQVENLELASSELASNCVRHGGGHGSLALWREPEAAVVEFTDTGVLTDPLLGRRRPEPGQTGGMGLYLVHQICDLVQVRTGAQGTTVRVCTWI